MNYLIIDDEPLAHKVIEKFAAQLGWLNKVGNAYDAFEGFEQLNSVQVDLIFLDINMPKLKGLDFLRSLANPPKVIITSAYREYALEGFELNVFDYLLKPFSFERFLTAVNKASKVDFENNQTSKLVGHSVPASNSQQVFIKGDRKYHQINLKDILYLESYGSYVKVHLKDQMILTHQTTAQFEKTLPATFFLRVHKSYIISKQQIETVEGNRIKIGKHFIPIGNFYKKEVQQLVKGKY